MPELRFRKDTSFDEGARMDALLRSPQVQRDLDALESHSEDAPDQTPTDKETDAE